MPDMIRLTGIWKSVSQKSGETYLHGNIGSANLLIFKNGKKQKDNDPDYIAYIAPPKRREAGEDSAPTPPPDDFPA